MGDALEKLFLQLQRSDKQRSVLVGKIAARLRGKLSQASGWFPSLKSWLVPLPTDASDLVSYIAQSQELRIALKPVAEMRLAYAELLSLVQQDLIHETKSGPGIVAWRHGKSLLVRRQRVESWANVRSASHLGVGGTAKHLPNTVDKKASRFLPGISVPDLEYLIFEHGRGHFDGKARLYMYALFQADVGLVIDRKKQERSNIVKVQFDRVARPKCERRTQDGETVWRAQGYQVQSHGYPISEAELRADFPAGADAVLAATPLCVPG